MLKVYNTLTRQKEQFIPLEPGKVKMYVCGPTVYNYIHIGNARASITFDTVRRYLMFKGYDVNYVSNFTDVDDKIILAAQQLGEDVQELTERFIAAYYQDTDALNCHRATHNPKVTEHMSDIIAFIEVLIDKGYAYCSAGDVYFRTRKFKDYGQLSKQSIDDLRAGARVDLGESKEDDLDFALWKAAKPGEIAWESPFGSGRPGWHIECSVMARAYLGDTLDIHAGGQDLTFPHHENEIAQSQAHNDTTFAKYWLHNGFLNVDNEKMSKSLGNFVTVHDILKTVDPNVLRFFMLSVHYRGPINFNDELLAAAQTSLSRVQTAYQNLNYRLKDAEATAPDNQVQQNLQQAQQRLIAAMDDDFNTANAITELYEVAKEANIYASNSIVYQDDIAQFNQLFNDFEAILGVKIAQEELLLDQDIEQLIEERQQARQQKNFARADEIRDILKAQNIMLEDTPQGVRWKRG